MTQKELLNEESYQKTTKKLFSIGIGIILIGVVVAVIMVIPKLNFEPEVSKEELQKQLAELKPALQERYDELEAKGVEESWDYKDEEGYEMTLIDIALDPTNSTCERSSLYSDNDTTREYCKVKAQIYELDNPKMSGGPLFIIVPSLMVLMPCVGIGAMLILTSKRREIVAFSAQQIMPVAQEGIEKMAPSAGVAAKEITKGIKEGLKDEEE